jgi:PAN domain-containing protein
MHQFRAILVTCVVAISITLMIPEQATAAQKMFVFVSQADSLGNDYSRTDHSSFEKCELSCERDVACNAFTYNQIKSECFLKTAPAQWTTITLGAITGIKLSPVLPSEGE